MKYLVNAAEMKACDRRATVERALPPLLLMERAAVSTADIICGRYMPCSVLIFCGVGNNGGDGAALARLLSERGFTPQIVIVGDELFATTETSMNFIAATRAGVPIVSFAQFKDNFDAYKNTALVVDAIFGIGLSRNVEGIFAEAIECINFFDCDVIALDIPSGINADTGAIMGCAVRAKLTVTYAYHKYGPCLYPGAKYSGEVILADAGIHTLDRSNGYFLEDCDIARLMARIPDSNKGTYGRVLAICGCRGMSGAAYLSASAAYKTGVGLVEVMTAEENRAIIQTQLPEAIVSDRAMPKDELVSCINRASSVLIGPGIGISDESRELLQTVLEICNTTIMIDADALNCIAKYKLSYNTKARVIITPHILEFSRITGLSVDEIKSDPIKYAKAYAKEQGIICTLKDARSVITDGDTVCINLSGCSGMSTGGSGDVLAGIIAGLAASGNDAVFSAEIGAFIHGRCGEYAAMKKGERSMLAHDITDSISAVLA